MLFRVLPRNAFSLRRRGALEAGWAGEAVSLTRTFAQGACSVDTAPATPRAPRPCAFASQLRESQTAGRVAAPRSGSGGRRRREPREAYLSGGDVDERYATDLFRERAVETIARHGALHGGANGSASDLLQ